MSCGANFLARMQHDDSTPCVESVCLYNPMLRFACMYLPLQEFALNNDGYHR